jgi:hypothetical protein
VTFFNPSPTRDGRCLVCSAANCACGGTSATVGIDERMEVAAVSGPLRKYRYTRGTSSTVLKLNDKDAERLGLTEADLLDAQPAESDGDAKAARPAANRSRGGAANKARTGAATKAGGKAASATETPTTPAAGGDGAGDAGGGS